MIKNDFYPSKQGDLTDTIANLKIKNGEFTDAYYLGYVSSDNLPKFVNVTLVEIDPGQDVIKFTPLLPPDNYNCGYIARNSSGSNVIIEKLFDYNNEYFQSQSRFINSLNVQSTSNLFINFQFAVIKNEDDSLLVGYPGNVVSVNTETLYNFLYKS